LSEDNQGVASELPSRRGDRHRLPRPVGCLTLPTVAEGSGAIQADLRHEHQRVADLGVEGEVGGGEHDRLIATGLHRRDPRVT
jgi:hypothetical protein